MFWSLVTLGIFAYCLRSQRVTAKLKQFNYKITLTGTVYFPGTCPDLNQERALVTLNKVSHQINVDLSVDAYLSILQICIVQKAE